MTSMRLNLNPKLEVVSQWPPKKKSWLCQWSTGQQLIIILFIEQKKKSLITQKHYSLNNTYKDKKVRGNRVGVSLTEVAGEH